MLLVFLMVMGGMASMSSLELNDASASDASGESKDSAASSNFDVNDCYSLGKSPYQSVSMDATKLRIADVKTEGRDSDVEEEDEEEPMRNLPDSVLRAVAHQVPDGEVIDVERHVEGDSLIYHVVVVRDDILYGIDVNSAGEVLDVERGYYEGEDDEWDLPEGVEVERTASGEYVLTWESDDGQINEELLDGEELRRWLARLSHDDDEREVGYDEWRRERGEDREEPEIHIEFMDDGTIVVAREGNFGTSYDIIKTSEDGKTSIIRIDARGTEVIYPGEDKPKKAVKKEFNYGLDFGTEKVLKDGDQVYRGPSSLADADLTDEEIERCKQLLMANKSGDKSDDESHPERPELLRETDKRV